MIYPIYKSLPMVFILEKMNLYIGTDMINKVKLYSLSTCGHCKAMKKFSDRYAVNYEATDVDLLQEEERTAVLADVRKINPKASFPTALIGDKVLVGFRKEQIMEALGL